MISISVGTGTCGVAAGAEKVLEELRRQAGQRKLAASVRETGCVGMCYAEVLLEVADGLRRYLYARVTPDRVGRILDGLDDAEAALAVCNLGLEHLFASSKDSHDQLVRQQSAESGACEAG